MSSSPSNITNSTIDSAIKKSVCICVDDYGLYPSINQAVIRLIELKRINAVSCLVGASAWGSWAPALMTAAKDTVDIGLHLDFIECSIDPKNRQSIAALILKSHSGLLNPTAVRNEIRTQLDRFETLFDRAPTFVDGHLHVHQFPIIRSELMIEIKRRYADNKPWIRSTRSAPRNQPHGLSWKQKIKPFVIQNTGSSQLLSLLTHQGYRHNQDFSGIYDFGVGGLTFANYLHHWLQQIAHGGLMMTHPSTGVDSADPASKSRHAEFKVMSSPQFDQWVSQSAVELKAMSQII